MIRLLLAAGAALVISLFGTRFLIGWLRRLHIGQPIHEDVPEGHKEKRGTPTMGGLAIVGGALLGYAVSDLYNGTTTRSGILVMLLIAGAGLVGLLDDWISVTNERNLGLTKRAKTLGLLGIAVAFALVSDVWVNVHTELSLTRWDSFGIDLGRVGWSIWAVFLIYGTANAVNLTDGLDGLAAGAASLAFAAFIVVGFWQFRHFAVYDVTHALDLAVVAAAMLGACAGFLWWNAAPAQIFMGDTGSLAIGAGLAGLALLTNTHLLLPIVGGLFVIETVSVILQVFSFRVFGRRIFRMSPIHHHFELGGWPETTVIIRMWIMSGLCTGAGLALFYADFVSAGGAG